MCCNGWSRGLLTLYCFSFLFSQQPTPMPVFALLALVAYSVSLALIIPGLLQKQQLAANGDFICDYRLDLPCFCAGSTDIPRRRERAKSQLTERRVAGQPDDLYGDDYRGLAQSRLAAAAYRLCLRADQLAFATFVPNEYITHPKPPRGCWCISACRSSRTPR